MMQRQAETETETPAAGEVGAISERVKVKVKLVILSLCSFFFTLLLALSITNHHVTTESTTSTISAGHVDEAAGESECEGRRSAEEECGGIAR